MSISDPIANALTKIRNACNAKHKTVDVYRSNFLVEVIKNFKEEGYISAFEEIKETNKKSKKTVSMLRIHLKYDENNNSVIHGIERISKSGRRVYCGYQDMPRVLNGYGILIVSTSSGVITGKKTGKQCAGGELVCKVW